MRFHTLLYTLCLLHAIAGADPAPCDKALILGFDQDKMTYTANRAGPLTEYKLTCNKAYQVLGYTDGAAGAKESHFLTCDPVAAARMWTDEAGGVTSLLATDRVTVTGCIENPCDKARVTLGPEVVFTPPTTPTDHASLSCASPKKLTIERVQYGELKCVKGTGWTDNGATKFPDDKIFDADCKVCTTSLLPAESTFANGVLKCVTHGKGVKYNSKFHASLTCDGAKWKDEQGADIGANADELLTVTCEDAPCLNIKKPSATDGGAPEDGIAADVIGSPSEGYTCKRDPRKMDGIKINDRGFVISKLFCDKEKGWTDAKTTKYADAFDAVTISCAPIPCDLAEGLCGMFTAPSDPAKLPPGYECLDAIGSPFKSTDNAYQLNCNRAPEKSQIYGVTSKTFYNYAPLCHNYSIWHDKDQKQIPDEPNKLICLHKRCNSCAKLVEATGSPTASIYKEGTASECAKATCPNNLWMIMKDGATSEVEYAGEVTCSTETINKWLIDGQDAIVKGSCVTSVKCKEAVRLNTKCEAAWTGCAEPTLSDDAAEPCKDNKMMFYKKPEETYFEGNVTSIECNKDKGHWKVKTNERAEEDTLKRGGSLVCADENPFPKPPPPACWVCPNSTDTQSTFTFRKTCNTCSDKDIQIKQIDSGATCEATVEYMTPTIKFDTEKAGVVEGKLLCAADGVWRSADGKEVGRFARWAGAEKQEGDMKPIFICGAVGGVILLVIILIVVFKVVMGSRKRKTEEEKEKEEKKKRMAEEGKKRQKSRGNNDEILDEVSSQAPSEIKL